MDGVPPVHGPLDRPDAAPPASLPGVARAVTGRARDLHQLADHLEVPSGDVACGASRSPTPQPGTTQLMSGEAEPGEPPSSEALSGEAPSDEPPSPGMEDTTRLVDLLRAHAGAVHDLAEHLRAAGAGTEPTPPAHLREPPGAPRSTG